MNVLCLDIGGSQIRAGLIGPAGILRKTAEPTQGKGDVGKILSQIRELSRRIVDNSEFEAVSLGCPGPVDGNRMMGSKPLDVVEEIDFDRELRDFFQSPVIIANDLNMAVRAEKRFGQAQANADFCLVSISTGIGVGVVSDGRVVNHRIEVGHSIVESDPRRARSCQGHSGCWVAQSSGSGIASGLRQAGRKETIEEFFLNPVTEMLAEIRDYTARGFSHVIHAFDPQRIVVMGSVGIRQFDKVIPSAEEIRSYCILSPIPTVAKTILGDEIGLLGAYELAQERR